MIRVREALSDVALARQLRGKIPKNASVIPLDLLAASSRYPIMLLKHLPNGSEYSYLDIITEHLLREKVVDDDALKRVAKSVTNINLDASVFKSVTTRRYIASVQNTMSKLNAIMNCAERVSFDLEISLPNSKIHGHPDMATKDKIFEVKTTGQLKQNWNKFLLQVFCYAALHPSAEKIYLVLPIQEYIWEWDVKNNWPKRKLFTDVLLGYRNEAPLNAMCIIKKNAVALTSDTTNEQHTTAPGMQREGEDPMFTDFIMQAFPIGIHVEKKKSLRATMQNLQGTGRPYQIFFTNRAVDFKIAEDDIKGAAEFADAHDTKLYVHTPYLINLSMDPGTDVTPNYVVECLRKHLRVGAEAGLKGIVVHVGKSVKLSKEQAVENMRTNLLQALTVASLECPLLLETPAGQGTELLTNLQDFMGFAETISNPGFGVCIDTCHVFATGFMPFEYLTSIIGNTKWRPLLKLVHFNDSNTPLNSHVDRHAKLGFGYIPKEQLLDSAQLCAVHSIPMIIE